MDRSSVAKPAVRDRPKSHNPRPTRAPIGSADTARRTNQCFWTHAHPSHPATTSPGSNAPGATPATHCRIHRPHYFSREGRVKVAARRKIRVVEGVTGRGGRGGGVAGVGRRSRSFGMCWGMGDVSVWVSVPPLPRLERSWGMGRVPAQTNSFSCVAFTESAFDPSGPPCPSGAVSSIFQIIFLISA